MSYEIVRNCSVLQDKETGRYYAKLKTASNNVWPHYYEEWTYGLGDKHLTKEEIEKQLLLDFFHGNLQGGSSRFRKTVQMIQKYDRQLLDRYYKIDKTYYSVSKRMWAAEDRDNERYNRLSALSKKLYELRNEEAKNVLYNYMKKNTKDINAKKVHPFVIIEKSSGLYVKKVTKTKYFTGGWNNRPHLFDSKDLWLRVSKSEWWNEHFVIEQVSAHLG
jgi:hypothetical protein